MTVWDVYKHELCPYCLGEHHYWDCETWKNQEIQLYLVRRGATGVRPTLWRCSKCLYSFWSYNIEQDPLDDGHCSNGKWYADSRAIALL